MSKLYRLSIYRYRTAGRPDVEDTETFRGGLFSDCREKSSTPDITALASDVNEKIVDTDFVGVKSSRSFERIRRINLLD